MYPKTGIFRALSDKEEHDFREWARENDPPILKNWVIYHPVCREEWEKRGIVPPFSGGNI